MKKEIVLEYLKEKNLLLTEEQEKIKRVATYDLYFGPIVSTDADIDDLLATEGTEYRGFEWACEQLRSTYEALPSELYVDDECDFVSEKEPEGYLDEETGEWIEPYLESTYLLTARDIREMVFGKELSQYL